MANSNKYPFDPEKTYLKSTMTEKEQDAIEEKLAKQGGPFLTLEQSLERARQFEREKALKAQAAH